MSCRVGGGAVSQERAKRAKISHFKMKMAQALRLRSPITLATTNEVRDQQWGFCLLFSTTKTATFKLLSDS